MEDNEAAIKAVQKGYSPALKALLRTHRLDVGYLHELFCESKPYPGEGEIQLSYGCTKDHKGDVFTKSMGPAPFHEALIKIGLEVSKNELSKK